MASKIKKLVVEKSRQDKLSGFADYLAGKLGINVEYADVPAKSALNLGGACFAKKAKGSGFPEILPPGAWQLLGETPDGWIIAGNDNFSIIHAALEVADHLKWGSRPAKAFRQPTFTTLEVIFDDYACGFNRTADNFDLEKHIRDTARTGIQNFEINRLFEAIPVQVKERRAWSDKYQWWCFYSPALDMFVESKLNRGTYKDSMLEGNRAEMKKTAELARKYGMKPVLQIFEPRLWPERLYDKFPELRGSRVDYATYSGEAEYSPDVNHPLVRQHYAEMTEALLREVPDLDLIEVWSNDSCAGFAWSKRTYMEANGPISHRKKPVAESVVNLLTSIRDGGRKINPKLRVSINLAWFIHSGKDSLSDAREVLKALPPDIEACATLGTYFRNSKKAPPEIYWELLDWARKNLGREIQVQFEEVSNPWKPLGPLQGIPYPETAADMLKQVKAKDVRAFTIRGGLTTEAFVPNFINNEVIRSIQYDGEAFNLEKVLEDRAKSWTSSAEEAELLRQLWTTGDDLFRHYNNSGISWTSAMFVSARTLFRHLISPVVPNPYLLAYQETAYYRPMEFHVGETDPSWFDISYYGYGQTIADDMMLDLVRRIDLLLEKATAALKLAGDFKGKKSPAITDLEARFRAFICMSETDRALFSNQEAIHAYLKSTPAGRPAIRAAIRRIQDREIKNVVHFIEVLDGFDGVLIPETSGEDNVYVIRAPITHQLKQKLKVMRNHLDDEPGPVIEGNYVKAATL